MQEQQCLIQPPTFAVIGIDKPLESSLQFRQFCSIVEPMLEDNDYIYVNGVFVSSLKKYMPYILKAFKLTKIGGALLTEDKGNGIYINSPITGYYLPAFRDNDIVNIIKNVSENRLLPIIDTNEQPFDTPEYQIPSVNDNGEDVNIPISDAIQAGMQPAKGFCLPFIDKYPNVNFDLTKAVFWGMAWHGWGWGCSDYNPYEPDTSLRWVGFSAYDLTPGYAGLGGILSSKQGYAADSPFICPELPQGYLPMMEWRYYNAGSYNIMDYRPDWDSWSNSLVKMGTSAYKPESYFYLSGIRHAVLGMMIEVDFNKTSSFIKRTYSAGIEPEIKRFTAVSGFKYKLYSYRYFFVFPEDWRLTSKFTPLKVQAERPKTIFLPPIYAIGIAGAAISIGISTLPSIRLNVKENYE